jgi:hypothetical protein
MLRARPFTGSPLAARLGERIREFNLADDPASTGA